MTPAELKRRVEATGSVFFSRSSMRFFGDTMRNYRVHFDAETFERVHPERLVVR